MLWNASRRVPRHMLLRHHLHASKSSVAHKVDYRDDFNAYVHCAPQRPVQSNTSGSPALSIGVKDNICTSDLPTSCASSILKDFRSPFDATVVSALRQAGAHINGKVNCDEFGMGSMNVHSAHGPVINPFNPAYPICGPRSAGGSSGGSAAAVAAGLCNAALGTDTGGSIRLPASYCGVWGFKPSYGIVSRWGVISYADSLDCVGVFARETQTLRRVFGIISGYDSKDPSAAPPLVRQTTRPLCEDFSERFAKGRLKNVHIGIPQEYFPAELSRAHLHPYWLLLKELKQQGAVLVPVSLPATQYALSVYYVIASAEASSCLARYDGIQFGQRSELPPGADRLSVANAYAHTRTKGFGDEVKRRILLGTYALTADAFNNYFLKAQTLRQRVKADFDRVFAARNVLSVTPKPEDSGPEVDVLLHPSAIRTAPRLPIGESVKDDASSGLDAYTQDVLTVPASLAGLPALSMPAGLGDDGWPVGVTVVGQWGCDETVLQFGTEVERILANTDEQSTNGVQ